MNVHGGWRGITVLLAWALTLAVCRRDLEPPADGDDAATGWRRPDGSIPDGSINVAVDSGGARVADAGPADTAGHTDVARPSCGVGGAPCCPGNRCEGGGCCVGGRCVEHTTACTDVASCFEGSCSGCGGFLEECCPDRACTASQTVCVDEPGGSVCRGCGGAGQPCCGDGFCASGQVCAPNARGAAVCRPCTGGRCR